MNENLKKALIVVAAVIAVVLAAGSAFMFLGGDHVTVVRRGKGPPPGKLWGKAAMMAHDTRSNVVTGGPRSGGPGKGSSAAGG